MEAISMNEHFLNGCFGGKVSPTAQIDEERQFIDCVSWEDCGTKWREMHMGVA